MKTNRRLPVARQLACAGVCAALAGCASESGEQTFYVGWTILGLICLGMLVLVGGFIRYISQGAKQRPQPAQPIDYQYDSTEDGEGDDPFRQP